MLRNCMHDAMIVVDRGRVLLSGEYPDYIHAVSANVSNTNDIVNLISRTYNMLVSYMLRVISRRRFTS